MKAISTIIATIIILLITIALAGTSYLFISGTFTGKTSTAFALIDAINDTVVIRNSGTQTINSLIATLDGNTANIALVPNIPGLVGYWSFNEGSGTTTDDNSDNGNVGTLVNGPTWTDGKYGKALRFDGVNDYVDVVHNNNFDFDNSTSFTLNFWLKFDILRRQFVFDTRDAVADGWAIETNPAGTTIDIGGRDDDSTALPANGVSITDLNWHFYSFVLERGVGINVYKDGVLGNGPASLTGIDNFTETSKFTMGGVSGGGFPCACLLDSVAIYRRALAPSEIQQLYSGLVLPGQLATIKPLTSLSKGTHTLRLCTPSMCNTAILSIQ